MKNLILGTILTLSASTTVAADISSTLSKTTSVAVTTVDRVVTGKVDSTDIKVGVVRGVYDNAAGVCNGCVDTNNNYAVGVTIDVTNRTDKLNTATTGTTTTTSMTCLEDLMVGVYQLPMV